MAIIKLLVLPLLALCAAGLPEEDPVPRNTIFGDERLEGEIFEKLDVFKDAVLYTDEFNPYRLPTTTRPAHYDILWDINIDDLTYQGTVEIDLFATEADVSQIVIHSTHHTITGDPTLVRLSDSINIGMTYTLDEQHHFMIINTTADLEYNADIPVLYQLTISFNAIMRNDMYGIYGSWYRNTPTDTISWMATTQFQSTAGRYAFPCYDEPSFKATFVITIRRPLAYNSWSCMRINETIPSPGVPGYEDDIYFQTPKMSTYLLAIIVADYENESVRYPDTGDIDFEVIARRGAIAEGQGDYAFNVGQKLLSNMSAHTGIDYFDVDINLKMTQAAIPDFGAGAMENWGLLTYREAYLLFDEIQTSGYFKQMIAYILSHEIAHMWFGNLVTCDWWDVLWLNEGFARYYQYFLTHWVEDYMGLETRFITEQVHTALLADSANNPHPLTNPGIGDPQQVSSMFSTLSYNKGAAVIRMTEHLLGFDVHEQGLQSYLDVHRFSTAHPIDLFRALQTAAESSGAIAQYPADFSVIDYYTSWTEQPGVPVLNVEINYQTGDMYISQRRFNINTGYSDVNANWIIPLTFSTASSPDSDFEDTKPTHILRETLSIINKGSVGEEWVVFNKQQIGYYRVNYDERTWNLIVTALRGPDRTRIHEYNRAQIVNDVFQFARSGIMTYTRAFTILSFLEFETDYAPWVAAITGFNWLRARFVGTPYQTELEALIIRWAHTAMMSIGYYQRSNETFMEKYLRYQLAPFLCALNARECRVAAVSQFRALIDEAIEVPADSRLYVYCNALREGTETDFDALYNRFETHNLYTEKITILQSIGCTPHAVSLGRYLTAIFQENYIVRPQDYGTALNSASTGNEGNTQILFDYIKENFELVNLAYPNMATPLSYVSSRLRTEEEIAEFQGWAWINQERLGTAFNAVFNGAESSRESIRYGLSVADDLNYYLVNGDQEIEIITETTPPPVDPVTEPQPVLISPQPPVIPEPSSATNNALSLFLVALGVAVTLRV